MEIIEGSMASPKGFHASGLHCGIKKKKLDIAWIYSEVPASVAGVFTTNQVKAAPVILDKEVIKNGKIQAIIANSGNANACTGKQGFEDALSMQKLVARKLEIDSSLVAVASTGIIGQALPMDKIEQGICDLSKNPENVHGFEKAILTTDTKEKMITITDTIGGKEVVISACSKGSGMIHPNMATMLGFVTTDINIDSALLQEILSELTEVTFNQITVDGDTSTNDTVLIMANGLAKNNLIVKESTDYQLVKDLFKFVLTFLAKEIARDGEGATKLIEVTVEGANSSQDARMLAKSVVGSMLVKSAIFGHDPNWGRILCSLGYSGISFNPEDVNIELAEIPVFKSGQPIDFDHKKMQKALVVDEIKIAVQVGSGRHTGKAWGCDLTYDYVKINALYHT
ncbi:bifunctional ornithine acetyltransferase/N-acetylglutamate synthase [Floricoccus tropicus]|uniref:Arginine biosynthesis bifunctional protein ArgJ n=1 Tax=Floricoccus tropicus TaxID=1859473 RepID=A0A1E8GL20_9LACT|nr:bifunctional ornithine acetyltransferase/N-acetylglutamate synthase [Floricoccus tropicus]OFI48940.1 bifunctional ornithine acetyltransferase/N-acetylglutamate synthase [Floricoccus tropicus]